MSKTTSIIALVLSGLLAAGCESSNLQARVHLRVFEVPMQTLRRHTPEQNLYKLPSSAYLLSVVSPNDLNAMLRSSRPTPRLLAERTRVVDDWPAVMDTWVYSPSQAGSGPDTLRTGGGTGSLGVRQHWGNLEVRLDYLVNHRGPQGQKLIESKLFFESPYPEGQVLLFHTPTQAPDGSPRQHVIAFEIARMNRGPAYQPASRRLSADISVRR
ncbi:MAG: hypothetical protein MUC88_27040 [Planctomycetes bacterium]|jgi:hypothetical protein|nr:hypothetical protein [Planctomycetota bacterium]